MLGSTTDTMTQHVKAIYENGVLRPLEPIKLNEHQEVMIAVDDQTSMPKANGNKSCFDLLNELGLVGAIDDAPADLSSNKAHFDDFGR